MSTPIPKRPEQRSVIGIPLFIISSLFVALMATTVKEVRDVETTASIIFWRNATSLVLLLPWIFFTNRSTPIKDKFKTNVLHLHLIRAICSFAAVYLYFFSLKYLTLSSATLLWNTIPIFIPLVAFFWKRVQIQHILWWGLGVAFVGIIVVLNPSSGVFHPASFLALLSGLIGAVAFVSMRYSHFSDTPEAMLFYLFLINTLLGGVATLFSYEESWTWSTDSFWLMILTGVFGMLYQIFLTVGSKYVPVRLGSIFIYFSVIFTIIFDQWIWKVRIPTSTYVGFGLIVLGAALLVILYPKDDYKIKGEQ